MYLGVQSARPNRWCQQVNRLVDGSVPGIRMLCLLVSEQVTDKRYSCVTPHHVTKSQVWSDIRHFPPYVIFQRGGSGGGVVVYSFSLNYWGVASRY
jgi:hypothetical protein